MTYLNSPATIRAPGEAERAGTSTHYIAIIGGGPKGLYGFERLVAQLAAHPPIDPVEIHIFNRSPHFGAGDVYHPEQPDYLLINFSIGNINMWLAPKQPDEVTDEPPTVAPNPLPLTDWLRCQHQLPLSVRDSDYASRAQVGRYLNAGFQDITDNLPPGVTCQRVMGEVSDIRRVDHHYRLRVNSSTGNTAERPERYEQILLATGHPRNEPTESEVAHAEFARKRNDIGVIPFIYPVEPGLTTLPAGCTVGFKGMGLTFVDAVLAMTEGTGGRFVRRGLGDLHYVPGGAEPAAIYPYSRSGMPMWPRGPAYGPAPTQLRFFTQQTIDALRQQHDRIDFERMLWPLVQQEMIFAFYNVLFRQMGHTLSDWLTLPFSAIQAEIDAFHQEHPYVHRFHVEEFLNPLGSQPTQSVTESHTFLVDYLRFMIVEARRGETASPWAAVTAVWKYITPLFGQIYRFGGLTPTAQRIFDTRYASTLNRIAFGPPIESMEKIVALADADILRFGLRGDVQIEPRTDTGRFHLCTETPAIDQPVQYLVDARIPKVSLTRNRSRLYKNLLRRGLIRPFENVSNETWERPYRPGCLALTQEGAVIDRSGNVNHSITVTGTPTEGITYDNDSLSRTRNNFVSAWAERVARQYAACTVPV